MTGFGLTIPTNHRHQDLLRGILDAADLDTLDVAVVADQPVPDWLPARAHVITERGDGINLHRWWNTGIDYLRARGCDHVAILSDDVVIDAGTLPALSAALDASGATIAVPVTPGSPMFAFMLNTAHGVRGDESYAWWYGDNQILWDADLAHGTVSVPEAFARHIHPNERTSTSPQLRQLAARDARTWRTRHPA